jgi:hypothetical protein
VACQRAIKTERSIWRQESRQPPNPYTAQNHYVPEGLSALLLDISGLHSMDPGGTQVHMNLTLVAFYGQTQTEFRFAWSGDISKLKAPQTACGESVGVGIPL